MSDRELLIVMAGRLFRVEQDLKEAKQLLTRAEKFVAEVRRVIDPKDKVEAGVNAIKKSIGEGK